MSFAAWLESQAASKTGPSGVGIENYDWYLKNVQLVPYTWQQEVALMERELARSRALLAMEELRNAAAASAGARRERRGVRHDDSTRRSRNTWPSCAITRS